MTSEVTVWARDRGQIGVSRKETDHDRLHDHCRKLHRHLERAVGREPPRAARPRLEGDARYADPLMSGTGREGIATMIE